MTREELIKALKDWKPELELMAKYNDNSIDYQRYRAIDETIKTLDQEPCEDCISRAEALNIINIEGKWIFNNDKVYSPVNVGIALTSMKKKIKELPSIQPIIQNIKALGEEMRICQRAIKDEKVLTGFNMAIALCNKHLSSIQPKPKTGEWQQDLDGTYLCSECGSGFKEQPTLMGSPMFLWCPLCGAKMIEPQEMDIPMEYFESGGK